MTAAPVVIQGLSYFYGEGALRRQVLFDIDAEIQRGEILILTGPSGSGKTTLLTLIGALRSVQQGSLRVLDHELRGANEARLADVRKRIGYIFQAHNLLQALSAQQNVQVTLQLHPQFSADAAIARAAEVLDEVGLSDRLGAHPSELSGGERQRVAIARALAVKPELLLADEPTASLDRKTGRGVIELLQRLAKQEGVTVVLVTHDSRILDIADRILSLDGGRLSSLMSSVATESRHMLQLLSEDLRKGHLTSRIAAMKRDAFDAFLEEVTQETQGLLEIADLVQGEALAGVEQQVVHGVEDELNEIFDAESTNLHFVDPDDETLRSYRMAEHGRLKESHAREIDGIAGHVMRTGEMLNVPDVRAMPELVPNPSGVGSALAAPIIDSEGQVFGVIEVCNKKSAGAFSPSDQEELAKVAASLGTLLETWWRMGCSCRRAGIGRAMSCCPPALAES